MITVCILFKITQSLILYSRKVGPCSYNFARKTRWGKNLPVQLLGNDRLEHLSTLFYNTEGEFIFLRVLFCSCPLKYAALFSESFVLFLKSWAGCIYERRKMYVHIDAVRIIVFDGFGEEIKSEERKDGQFKF